MGWSNDRRPYSVYIYCFGVMVLMCLNVIDVVFRSFLLLIYKLYRCVSLLVFLLDDSRSFKPFIEDVAQTPCFGDFGRIFLGGQTPHISKVSCGITCF